MKTLTLTLTEFIELMESLSAHVQDDQKTVVEETDGDEDGAAETEELSLIEQVIENFLKECISSKRLPTLAEAEVVKILDDILIKYED